MSRPRPTTDASAELSALFERADQLVHTDPAELLATADQMVSTVDAHGSVDERLRIRRVVSLANARTNRFEDALAIGEEALALAGADEAPLERARVAMAFMEPLANLNRVDEAIAVGKNALDALEEMGETSIAGIAAMNIGAIQAMIGRPADALSDFERAREYLSDNPMMLGQAEINLGTTLAMLDRFELAGEAFERAAVRLMQMEIRPGTPQL